jgi:DNA-directed RNA polymerase subunit beta'
VIDTTPGRMKLGEHLPKHPEVQPMCNQSSDQESMSADDRHRLSPLRPEGDRDLLRQDHGLGFKKPARAGISFGKDDMVIPDAKKDAGR